MTELRQNERRRYRRITFIKEVDAIGVGKLRCSDLDLGGMHLETVHSYPVGTILDLWFKLRDTDEHPILVQAKVVYVLNGMGVGLGFSSIKPEDRQKLEKFIEERLL